MKPHIYENGLVKEGYSIEMVDVDEQPTLKDYRKLVMFVVDVDEQPPYMNRRGSWN